VATISLQMYWNVKNYEENKKRLINDVQIAFDNSIEHYYAEEAKNNYVSFIGNSKKKDPNFVMKLINDTVFKNNIPKKLSSKHKKTASSTIILRDFTEEKKAKNLNFDTNDVDISNLSEVRVIKGQKAHDSLLKIKDFTNKIIISMFKDSIEFEKVALPFKKELARKDIQIEFGIELFKNNVIFQKYYSDQERSFSLSTFSNSAFSRSNEKIKLLFSNPILLVLKRSLVEIILSLLLSLSIIFCLLYLLKTINRQKKIDEIKNDLISNITHEFKTPITTVSTAIEGLRNFNDINDVVKTKRYLDISSDQLKKLEIMVEKLLETASIDTDKLVLHKESANLIALLKNLIEKYKMICPEKTISFEANMEQLLVNLDGFHFENALSNLIDNAVKYGGNVILVSLTYDKNKIEINVEDSGLGIEKSQRDKIFDKFYRIPKGNIHDIKGFGIGLFYSRKIIEKHDGTLELVPSHLTTFKITLHDA